MRVKNRGRCLHETPVWVFHGAADPIMPALWSEQMAARLQDCGGDVKLTVYPGVGHDAWTRTYDNPELYEWLLEHRRKDD
jgi:predicted peptidase